MISVVIPSYNSASTLPELLNVLQKQESVKKEIILVDDKSTDNTREIVQQFKNIRYILNKENLGRAKSRNRGIKDSKGDKMVFLDSDCIPLNRNFLELYANYLDKRPNDILMGKVIIEDKIIDEIPFTGYMDSRANYSKEHFDSVTYNEFVTSNFAVARETLEGVGQLDESFVHYGLEDAEFAIRANKKGYKILFCPSCAVKHIDPELSLNAFKDKFYTLGRYTGKQLFEKHPEAREGFKDLHYLEPIEKNDSFKKKVIHTGLILQYRVFRKFLKKNIGKFEVLLPKKILYLIYRLILANKYLSGVQDR